MSTTATKSKTSQEFLFKTDSPKNLINFLTSMLQVKDDGVFEITNGMIVSKTYSMDRTLVKYIEEPLNEVFCSHDIGDSYIYCALPNIAKFIKIIKNFTDNTTLEFKTQTGTDGKIYVYEIILKSRLLKFTYNCGSLQDYKVLDTAFVLDTIFGADEDLYKFVLPHEVLSELLKISDLDRGGDKNHNIKFYVEDSKLYASGLKYEYMITDTLNGNTETDDILFFHEKLSLLNTGSHYDVSNIGKGYLFSEQGSNTKTLIARSQE